MIIQIDIPDTLPEGHGASFKKGIAERQATRPGLAVRGTFSPARAWRPAAVARLARTLGVRKHHDPLWPHRTAILGQISRHPGSGREAYHPRDA